MPTHCTLRLDCVTWYNTGLGLLSKIPLLQALRADAEAKAGMLERAAEAQQCLQAEVNRLKQAYTRERDLAKASQEDNTLWKSKAKAKEEVCTLQQELSCMSHKRQACPGYMNSSSPQTYPPQSSDGADKGPIVALTLLDATCFPVLLSQQADLVRGCMAQELKDAMQHQKLLQEAVASAEALSQDAQQHQRNTAQENAALKQEIQVSAQICHDILCLKILWQFC